MAKGDDIEGRLIDFAVRIVKLSDSLPDQRAANHIAGQLLRSGTSPAAQYAEARGAESVKDFQHKLKICYKELSESLVWLQIISKSQLAKPERLNDLYQECDELCRIINASIKTSRSKQADLHQ
ncbi:MAG: four helix bundle protein [Candidatus Promineifilaceae bacterium]